VTHAQIVVHVVYAADIFRDILGATLVIAALNGT
jgi:hypothetical protein